MRKYFYILAVMYSFFSVNANSVSAQINEDLYIYGYFQGVGRYTELKSNPRLEIGKALGFSIQQMNLFLFKQFDSEFSGFINLEITNSLSTENGWGGIALEEAWVKYDLNNAFKVKAGLIVPTFNNLNAISNKTPLLPYIMRPLAYETIVQDFLSADQLVPNQAAIELYGTLPLNPNVKFDYAAYVGNNSAFVVSEALSTLPTGSDSTLSKLFGGRVGIRYNELKAGVSTSLDKANLSRVPVFSIFFDGVGQLPRTRVATDLSLTFSRVFFESEFIRVYYRLNDSRRQALQELASSNLLLTEELDKLFAYATLGYNFGEQYFVYGMYSYLEDRSNIVTTKGFGMHSVGGGFRPNDNIVLKVQYVYTSTYRSTLFFGKEKDVLIGISVFL